MWVGSTYLDMGFTLASTTARTLQFLMFSGNSWIPGEKEQKSHKMFKGKTTTDHQFNTCCCSSTILLLLTKQMTHVKTKKMRDNASCV